MGSSCFSCTGESDERELRNIIFERKSWACFIAGAALCQNCCKFLKRGFFFHRVHFCVNERMRKLSPEKHTTKVE